MSSEEMRIELERFVNTGLREGWTGWPLKAENNEIGRLVGQWPAGSLEGWFCGRDRSIRPVGLENTFTRLHSLC